jgi:cytochrome d ubiquinol oxidase subunit I
MIPLPYIAIETGWIVAEVGRQPWIVYGLMRTSDAVSPVAGSQVLVTLIGFIVLYSILGIANFLLIARLVRKGPESLSSGMEVEA